MWTRRALRSLLSSRWTGQQPIVVSHQAPHEVPRLESSLNPLLSVVGGTWISGVSEDSPDRAATPSNGSGYKVRRVPLSRDLENEYYHGLANQGLWPLCHGVFRRPVFERQWWESYRRANELFAD